MKILTLFGTRPEIIRLSVIIKLLDLHAEQVLVHTGQNYDPNLSQIFLDELEIRPVDHHFHIQATTFGSQVGQLLTEIDVLLSAVRPDRILILGDTNSGLAAIVAARKGIPVYHLEAGNRCYDNRVPEEVNRRIIDHSSDVLLPYTERSAQNLVSEGIRRERIFVVGNPIFEVLRGFEDKIRASDVLERLGLSPRGYFVVTMHRAENVDPPGRLKALMEGVLLLAKTFGMPAIMSVHPRTADRIARADIVVDDKLVRLAKPFGLFDFVALEKNACGVVTDSGTVQEEACVFGIPNVTIRDVTERPETTECGANILSGACPKLLVSGMKLACASRMCWAPPVEYLKANVAETVVKILLSHR